MHDNADYGGKREKDVFITVQIGDQHYAFYGKLDEYSRPFRLNVSAQHEEGWYEPLDMIRALPPRVFDIDLQLRLRRDEELPNVGQLTDFSARGKRTAKMLARSRKAAKRAKKK